MTQATKEFRLMTEQEMAAKNFAEWAYLESKGLTSTQIEEVADQAIRDANKAAADCAGDGEALEVPDRRILIKWLNHYRDSRDEDERD